MILLAPRQVFSQQSAGNHRKTPGANQVIGAVGCVQLVDKLRSPHVLTADMPCRMEGRFVSRGPELRLTFRAMLRERWSCSFLEEDLKTPLRRKVTFKDPQAMLAFARRGGCAMTLEDRQSFERGLEIGRGGLWLALTKEQHGRLK